MITLFTHRAFPNGWKPSIVLEELGIAHEKKYLKFGSGPGTVKDPGYLKYNPNGRIPCIVDHDNDDFVLWESTSIIRYLLEAYDKEHRFSYPRGTKEYYILDQWLTFQASGQGPYFGQVTWFKMMHPEHLPTALERYQKEAVRVFTVLDGVLSKQKYLVGDKPTAADVAFFPWDNLVFDAASILDASYLDEIKQFTNVVRWHEDVKAHTSVKGTFEERAKAMEGYVPSLGK